MDFLKMCYTAVMFNQSKQESRGKPASWVLDPNVKTLVRDKGNLIVPFYRYHAT